MFISILFSPFFIDASNAKKNHGVSFVRSQKAVTEGIEWID
jgi:hypothetical protein